MDHIENLTKYIGQFVDELARTGLTDVVISPGSRSTPIAMLMVEHPNIKDWVIIDERSAAFFALGLAKKTQRPVALVCTSGTAAANYYPAIVEAHYSRVPLIVLTADRPHELRDVGAPQAIQQINLYGEYVKWFHEMALPEATPRMLTYVRSQAARAFHTAMEDNQGPVHLNFPLREPLVPNLMLENLWGEAKTSSYAPTHHGKKKLSVEQVEQFIATIADKKRGLIVCGPQPDEGIRSALLGLAEKWHIPILADPLSQMRSASEHSLIIESYDAILKSKEIRQYFKPDFIIRFGAMPISKPYLFFVEEHADAAHFVVEKQSGFRDPVGHATEYIFSDPIYFCEDMQSYELSTDKTWAEQWQHANERAKQVVKESFSGQLTEGKAVHTLIDELPQESTLYVGNSMAIRDVDTFFMKTKKSISVLANRGANGIDGMISSGLGAAASHTRVSLLLGDLSFFHDMNGLLATKHYEIDMTILLINNNGGGIFSFLPQAKNGQHFELLFGTPLHIEFQHAVQMYGGHYSEATSDAELVTALQASYKRKGLSVIEVKTDREENARWHQEIWNGIHDELIQIIGE